jgi:uncharacterized pyridoxamine 5'-phosphate oxidase family protein/NAD-dependent dihydropyrimidine dehydrogenase PreA subunit
MDAHERKELFRFLTDEIHSTIFATVDEDGRPRTCVIDIVLYDEDSVYFMTARGKRFFDEATARGFGALTGKHGKDTMSTIAISLRGKLRDVGPARLLEIFEKNPHLNLIYRTEESRRSLTVFQMYEGEGEVFDLRVTPPRREVFAFGGAKVRDEYYRITDACSSCGSCAKICPSGCIKPEEGGSHPVIDSLHCIRCGNCREICAFNAVERIRQ